jgi:predicted DNA-binding transcriptional regulator AlpA
LSTDKLTTANAAALLGVTPATFRSYVAKGYAPPPDGHHDQRTPFWLRSTIETWQASRPRTSGPTGR